MNYHNYYIPDFDVRCNAVGKTQKNTKQIGIETFETSKKYITTIMKHCDLFLQPI